MCTYLMYVLYDTLKGLVRLPVCGMKGRKEGMSDGDGDRDTS